MFLHGRVLEAAERVGAGMSMDAVLTWKLVELFVGLVEDFGLSRELMSLCSVLGRAAGTLYLWLAVESYISLLLQ
jgi:hypothetical protein